MNLSTIPERKVLVLPMRSDAVKVHCRKPGCTFVASARTEGRAVSMLAAHIATAHWPVGVVKPSQGAA